MNWIIGTTAIVSLIVNAIMAYALWTTRVRKPKPEQPPKPSPSEYYYPYFMNHENTGTDDKYVYSVYDDMNGGGYVATISRGPGDHQSLDFWDDSYYEINYPEDNKTYFIRRQDMNFGPMINQVEYYDEIFKEKKHVRELDAMQTRKYKRDRQAYLDKVTGW